MGNLLQPVGIVHKIYQITSQRNVIWNQHLVDYERFALTEIQLPWAFKPEQYTYNVGVDRTMKGKATCNI